MPGHFLACLRPARRLPDMLEISPAIAIADDELIERFVRSSGPGGQNVNKVATAVELRFDAANSPSLPDDVRARLLARRDRRITSDGVIVINAQRFRTQDRNREDARERLAALVQAALKAPVKRVPTKPTRASKERRLTGKRERSQVKSTRATRTWDRE
ncbi:MAG: peptidyl-tRNA hydrolase [Gammaproteobacteria bacterium RIFCSPHIGHO2_12_FULL_63_22]|nr:MAG: peptidyl-tRNA hydrolase [Gammaproteobacteria bacterium RIFCSPHIGHO2_12_FULL_63_22]